MTNAMKCETKNETIGPSVQPYKTLPQISVYWESRAPEHANRILLKQPHRHRQPNIRST
jgi:hypothetical protein